MEKLISGVALVVSIAALLFGGYFSSSWQKEVTKADISLLVRDVRYEYISEGEKRVEVSSDLQARSKRANHFPTLKGTVTKKELEEHLRKINIYKSAAVNIEFVVDQLDNVGATESDAKKIWNSLSPGDKAALLDIRTKRVLTESLKSIGAENVDRIVEDFLNENSEDSEHEKFLSMPGVRGAVQGSLRIAAILELKPTKESILQVAKEDMLGLKVAANEFASFENDVKGLLDIFSVKDVDPVSWNIDVTAFNTGGAPMSLFSIGALSLQKPAEGNIIVNLTNGDIRNFIIPPGGAVDISLKSEGLNPELNDTLISMYNTGDRDFIMTMLKVGGGYVTSPKYNFSGGIDTATKKALERYSEKLEI